MTPSDWLLLLVAFRAAESSEHGLDPVRLQKGMFLFAESEAAPRGETYPFEPYFYGPWSRRIYRDIDELVAKGFVRKIEVPGRSWVRYALTLAGLERAHAMTAALEVHAAARRLAEIKVEITGQSFRELLDDVYDRYPAYASRSVFRPVPE